MIVLAVEVLHPPYHAVQFFGVFRKVAHLVITIIGVHIFSEPPAALLPERNINFRCPCSNFAYCYPMP